MEFNSPLDNKYDWEKILYFISQKKEFHTVPSNNRKRLKYKVVINADKIIISKVNDENSINISVDRKISKEEFERVADKYEEWKNLKGGNRNEIQRLSQNSSYIFGILDAFENK